MDELIAIVLNDICEAHEIKDTIARHRVTIVSTETYFDEDKNKDVPYRLVFPLSEEAKRRYADRGRIPSWFTDHRIDRIGIVGWNHKDRLSLWADVDIDHVATHDGREKKDHTSDEINALAEKLANLPYCEVRRSTSGRGLHVRFHCRLPATSHRQHIANSEAIIRKAAIDLQMPDFREHACTVGQNLWVWAINAADDAFSVINSATERIEELTVPSVSTVSDASPAPIELSPLAAAILEDCQLTKSGEWYHGHVAQIRRGLSLWGLSIDLPTGDSNPSDANCFARFSNDGFKESLFVKRFNTGEHTSVLLATRLEDAMEGHRVPKSKTGYTPTVDQAGRILNVLGARLPEIPPYHGKPRSVCVSRSNDEIEVRTDKHGSSDAIEGFASKPTSRDQSVLLSITEIAANLQNVVDDSVRFLVRPDTEGDKDNQWEVKASDGRWIPVNQTSAKARLKREGFPPEETFAELQMRYLKLVCNHFQPVGPVGDELNSLGCPQPKSTPGECSHYRKITKHLGQFLQSGVGRSAWCERHGIDGQRYIELWFACVLQQPYCRLPMLSANSYSTGTGKTKLRDIAIRMVGKNFCTDGAKEIGDKWSGHLRFALFAYFEEVDLRPNIEQIKDMITSQYLSIRKMQTDQFLIRNSLHLIHTSNDPLFAPIDYDDRRVVVFDQVERPKDKVNESSLLRALDDELPQWIHYLSGLIIPEQSKNMDFPLPVLETDTKRKILNGELKPKRSGSALRDKHREEFRTIIADETINGMTPSQLTSLFEEPMPTVQQVGVFLRDENWTKQGNEYFRPQNSRS